MLILYISGAERALNQFSNERILVTVLNDVVIYTLRLFNIELVHGVLYRLAGKNRTYIFTDASAVSSQIR